MKLSNRFYAIVFPLGTLGILTLLTLQPALAQSLETPEALVRRMTQEVQSAVRADQEIQSGNLARSLQLIEAKILPSIDFQRMTAIAAGRHWQDATAEQQRQLTGEFRSLLVSMYSGAIAHVKERQFEVALAESPSDTEAVVRSRATMARGEPILIGYRLEKTAAGWKIYDVNIMGAWLAETYRNSFASEIARAGIDGLIKRLAEKNKVQVARGQ